MYCITINGFFLSDWGETYYSVDMLKSAAISFSSIVVLNDSLNILMDVFKLPPSSLNFKTI